MKKQSTTLLARVSKDQITGLTTIVEETLALTYNAPVTKVFTAADLWNIQRQKRTTVQRRFIG